MALLKSRFAKLRGRRRSPGTLAGRLRRPCAGFLVICLGICGPAANAANAQTASAEYQLKAAFLFNFAKFIEWPPAAFSGPQANFTICILGADPFGHSMDELLQGKTIEDRRVSIERSRQLAEVRHCQMVFVSSSEKSRVREILDGLKGTSVLAVGETEGFAAAGGSIQFAIEDNHVRFVINTDAAGRAGLKVSSNLLSLAHVIHDGEKNDRS
jgi:hypothetical protein